MKRLIASLLTAAALAAPAVAGAQPAAPVQVVELYTSQGCSSCPPANAALAAISARPEILALSFGVTYWDDLGWKDTFAQKRFTDRQWDYARGLRHTQVATPQVVVNGRLDTVGGSVGEIDAALKRAILPAGGPTVTLGGGGAAVAGPAPARPAEVWLVRYDPNVVQVPIKRGENTGKTLPHKNVVRELTRLGDWNGGARRFPVPAGPMGLNTAILLQAGPGGPILAAAKG
ncbi:MAG TPA: DUF1223 domain-containing protein [Phenylobacterium sp.]|jgi:hypothetical protein|uniref:DUF1223 domain-containing protein n=1 Tax=Phenylobacterium sp. TaxID=1871053 RepID=UPI002B6FFE52|nr:DUF1223 domain-containing protein [Phenylobacterium sp.]HXA41008.1 DUF1223 domain-containing protein [Phenylobacterium sp.]